VARKIRNAFPEVKILVCLRNPIDRAYSQFYFAKYRQGIEKCCRNFMEAFERHPNFYYYSSLYYEQLKRYFDLFPRKNILVLIYEDIPQNPLGVIQSIYRFLGVDDSFVPPSLNKRINPAVKYSHPFLVKVYSWSIKLLQRMGMGTIIDIGGRMRAKKLLNFVVAEEELKRPPLDSEVKKYLHKIFAEDIKNLEKLLGRDLSFWQ
jgi:hypothetical protein